LLLELFSFFDFLSSATAIFGAFDAAAVAFTAGTFCADGLPTVTLFLGFAGMVVFGVVFVSVMSLSCFVWNLAKTVYTVYSDN